MRRGIFVFCLLGFFYSNLPAIEVSREKELGFFPKQAKFALVIGIDEYKNQDKLKAAEKDAADFSKALVNNLNFSKENIWMISGREATFGNIKSKIEEIESALNIKRNDMKVPKGIFLLYFAGHGTVIPADMNRPPFKARDYNALLPYDAAKYYSSVPQQDNYITDYDLKRWFDGIRNYCNIVFIIDACFQGREANVRSVQDLEIEKSLTGYRDSADYILTASGKAFAREKEKGIFTGNLIGVISDKTKYPDGKINIKDIYDNVRIAMKNEKQKPLFETVRLDDLVLSNMNFGALEVQTNVPARITVSKENGEVIAEEDNIRLVVPVPKDIKTNVSIEATEEITREERQWLQKYVWKKPAVNVSQEEYKFFGNIDIRDSKNIMPAYVILSAKDERGTPLGLDKDNDISIPIGKEKLLGVEESGKNIYKLSLLPGYFPEILASKEEYEVLVADYNREILLNSGDRKEVNYVMKYDPDYWNKKIDELEGIPVKDGRAHYLLSRAFYKNAERTGNRDYYIKSQKNIFSAVSKYHKSIEFNKFAAEVSRKLSEIYGGNQKYKDDYLHFQNVVRQLSQK